MNFKHRVIYKSQAGKYFVKTDKGMAYKPKAKFYKNPAGSTVATKYVKNLTNIPAAIRPKFERKERANKGGVRLPYEKRAGGVRVQHVKRTAYIGKLHEGYSPVKRRGRKPKSPAMNRKMALLLHATRVGAVGRPRGPRGLHLLAQAA